MLRAVKTLVCRRGEKLVHVFFDRVELIFKASLHRVFDQALVVLFALFPLHRGLNIVRDQADLSHQTACR
jgi:hypothetical protein